MKTYITKNGWYYKGKHIVPGGTVELSDTEYEDYKDEKYGIGLVLADNGEGVTVHNPETEIND